MQMYRYIRNRACFTRNECHSEIARDSKETALVKKTQLLSRKLCLLSPAMARLYRFAVQRNAPGDASLINNLIPIRGFSKNFSKHLVIPL